MLQERSPFKEFPAQSFFCAIFWGDVTGHAWLGTGTGTRRREKKSDDDLEGAQGALAVRG